MSRQCPDCGATLNGALKYCPACGISIEAAERSGAFDPPVYTKRTFYDRYASVMTKGSVVALAVMCFLSAGLNLLMSLLLYVSLIDCAFLATMGILLLIKKSWKYALALVVYNAVGTIVSLLFSGSIGGIGVWIIGLICAIRLRKLQLAYEKYEQNGECPIDRI